MADKEKKPGFFGEFKTFISRGNVMDMAVGVVVGGAFTAIVNSLVGDIINPLIGKIFGAADLKELKVILTAADEEAGIAEVAIRYGAFIHAIINFLIVALCIFTVVRAINRLKDAAKKKEEEEAAAQEPAPEEPAEPSEDILLLREIRDALASKKE